jgi:hypothetical protein
MAERFEEGDHVEWGKPEDRTRGVVRRTLTGPYTIKTFEVPATKDDPWILLRTDRTGAEAAHRPAELRRIED